MDRYYVHTLTDAQGDHEVHKSTCDKLPKSENRIYLGEFSNCQQAVIEAKKRYSNSNGCYWCSRDCHTT